MDRYHRHRSRDEQNRVNHPLDPSMRFWSTRDFTPDSSCYVDIVQYHRFKHRLRLIVKGRIMQSKILLWIAKQD
jgi:hypothetical protein